jgi:hypothetical protein
MRLQLNRRLDDGVEPKAFGQLATIGGTIRLDAPPREWLRSVRVELVKDFVRPRFGTRPGRSCESILSQLSWELSGGRKCGATLGCDALPAGVAQQSISNFSVSRATIVEMRRR